MADDWEKLDLRQIWKVSKCGDGYHFRIPKKIADAFELNPRDEIRVHLVEVRRTESGE